MKAKLIAGLSIFVVAATITSILSQVKANGCSDIGFIAGARPDPNTGLLIISTVPQISEECEKKVNAPVIAKSNPKVASSPQDQPEVYYQSMASAPQVNIVPNEVSVPEVVQIPAPNIVNPPAQIEPKIVPAPRPIAQTSAPKTIKLPAAVRPAVQPIVTKPKSTAILVEKPSTALGTALNLDKLSVAVAMQETHNCKDKTGSALLNNCHGFKKNGKFMKFNNQAESHAYFKQLWAKSYKTFPNLRLAQIYSGNDRAQTWLKNVTYYYYNS
ncbi:MAG: hypothetical protein WC843_00200 [Candidatus Gracilibacteria bacterium]|jgi:hypothetical protein